MYVFSCYAKMQKRILAVYGLKYIENKGGRMDEKDVLTNRQLGFELKAANNMIRRKIDAIFAQMEGNDINGMQGPLLGYLYHKSRNGDVYQKDVEKEFRIRRSTATVMLQNLEQKGYIVRVASTEDARLKRILLTEKAIEHHNLIEEQIRDFNRELENGITEEEKQTFLTILDKMMRNLGMDGERVESSNVPCRNE